MELHERFMKIAGLESSAIEVIENDFNIQESIDVILTKSLKENFKKLEINLSKELLELQRLLLCMKYKKIYKRNVPNSSIQNNIKFCKLVEFLKNDQLLSNKENLAIFFDILILHLILLEDQKNFIHLFEEIRTSNTCLQLKKNSKLSVNCYLKLLKCFLETWEILNFFEKEKKFNAVYQAHLQSCKKVFISSIMYDLQTCLKYEETSEWHVLHSVLSKILHISKDTKILSGYAQEVFNNGYFSVICVLCDFVFPIDSSDLDIDFSLIFNESLWILIQDKFISKKSPERKQGLYLFKRLIDFIDLNENEIKKLKSSNLIKCETNPFICCQDDSQKISIKQVRTDFIIILETLEEKQKHLVFPSLSLIDNLVRGILEHETCGNCINLNWIYCIFSRILHHDNSSVVRWGLIKLLKLNVKTYSHDLFILLIIKSLNNTFLYETNSDESDPEISEALTAWFINFHHFNSNLIKKFVNLLSEISWAPVPIFYILNSLNSASDKLNNISMWEQKQLDAIRFIVENNIKLHPPMLSSGSQVLLLKIIPKFCNANNLTAFSNLLLTFSEKDIKEQNCWCYWTSWITKIQYDTALDFVKDICNDLKINDAHVRISMPIFAIIIQLLCEAKVMCQVKQCHISQELSILFLNLEKIDSRPYVPVSFIIKVIDLMYNLIDLQNPPSEFILQYLVKYKETIFKFILKLFYYDNLCYEEINICIKILSNIKEELKDEANVTSILTNTNIKYLETKCLDIFSNINKHNEMQLLLALQLWSNISHCYTYDDEVFYKIVNNLLQAASTKNKNYKLTGKTSLDYYTALSKLIRNHINTMNIVDLSNNEKWLHVLSSILDASGNQVLIYFGDIMYAYSAAIINDHKKLENFKILVKNFSNYNFASKREKIFWLVMEKLTKCLNSSNFVCCKSLQDISEEFNNQMLSEGDLLQSLKYILLTCCKMKKYFTFFMKVILNGLIHGQVLRRDQRINMQAYLRCKKLLTPYNLERIKFGQFETYDFISRQYNVDATIRAAAILQLSTSLNYCSENASLFLPLVVEKLFVVQKKRYFADSQLHRLKQRIFQILLILQPYLNKESTQIVYKLLCNSVIEDTDQHSIRLMKEWLLIKIYLSNKNLLSDLWLFFDKVYNERPGSINSAIGIIWHVAQQLKKENLDVFIDAALSKLAICCLGQQFGMRLFGQIFFIKFYDLLNDCHIKSKYLSFYQATIESLNYSNIKKNHLKIDEDFFYTIFDPVKHYTLETIYYHLPRLSSVNFEEWITKDNFADQVLFNNEPSGLKISNSDNSLDKAEISLSTLKSTDHKSEDMENCQSTIDIQKKITPWKSLLPNEEQLEEMINLNSLQRDTKNNKKIMVVASLVEKPQNLGGIARTCEIFGVKELIISSLKEIEEKSFQALSVSADKWIKLTEVKPFLLGKHLSDLKDNGWTLIGAEQTVNSINLLDFKFPDRTALILGNEKNGIPSNIIPLLDACVEIPQFGIIRSLNVHVTSAICVWEYIKQHNGIN